MSEVVQEHRRVEQGENEHIRKGQSEAYTDSRRHDVQQTTADADDAQNEATKNEPEATVAAPAPIAIPSLVAHTRRFMVTSALGASNARRQRPGPRNRRRAWMLTREARFRSAARRGYTARLDVKLRDTIDNPRP